MNLYLLLGVLVIFSLVYDKKENSIFLYLFILFFVFIIVSLVIISKNIEFIVEDILSYKVKSVWKKLEIE